MKKTTIYILLLFVGISTNNFAQNNNAKKLLDEVSSKMTSYTNMKIIFNSSLSNEEAGIKEGDEAPMKGSTGTDICTEETPCNPLSLYGKTKGEAERILLEDYDNAVCFRLATVYGRSHRQRMDLLVNNLVYSSMINRRLEVFDGHFRRNYIHVDDIVSAFTHALDNFESMRGEVYNLGNDSVNMSKLDLVKKICHETRAVWVEVQDKTDPDKRDYIVSSQKLYDTGFKPKYNLDYGIKQMMMVCSENWKNFADVDYMSMCKNY
jgi:nucleoside-diphosphate-sugar epimerase